MDEIMIMCKEYVDIYFEDDRCEFDEETLELLCEFTTDEDLDRDLMVRIEDYCHC